jgi:alpha-D-xyloside xylohydrolase
VKAGSILPIGPKFNVPKKMDNLEIRVYPGADEQFLRYENENNNYDCQKGVYSTISFNWDDSKKTLAIGDRQRSFPAMVADRKFNSITVGKNIGVGANVSEQSDKVVNYSGRKVVIKL